MTTGPADGIPDADLMGYLDRSLDAARAAEVEAALDTDPEARARLEDWQHQNALIAGLYQPAAAEPLPPRLNLRRIAAERAASRNSWQRMAATVLFLAVGAGGGWYFGRLGTAPGSGASPDTMADALAAHRLYAEEVVHPVAVSGDPGGSLGKWLSKRLDRKLTIPNLERAGWRLVGGSLLPAGDKAGAQIMYEDGAGRRLTLFFTPVQRRKGDMPRFAMSGDLDVMTWADGDLGCTIVAPISRPDIKQIAAEVYEQLG